MDGQNEPLLLRADENGVARLTLNRPKAFNSLSRDLLTALEQEVDRIAADSTTRVVIVAGNGKAFCAGHDLKEMGEDLREAPIRALFDQCSRIMVKLTRLPQPVIARVHGIATAAGCQLVAACDLAVCTEDSRFAVSGVKYGLFCSTPMVALSRNLPRKPAMEMLLTGDFIDAREALRLGLVNRVVPAEALDAEIAALTARLLDKSPRVLALGKRAFYRQLELGLEEAYAFTTDVIVENALGRDFAAGLDAFRSKRAPVWPEDDA
ncbi:enoyl-CoA hydratase [Benzoatithermus flavus]|uniref:Enoyl-CoA hydratase domain-containing protein 3, mitochondrial n=1 Tax=Benzoatithermus flavus TaxID=3108223 RepID=A0ABU8XXC9_9PROT